jgi:2-hydroxychromene-2-carboxylate isomerase
MRAAIGLQLRQPERFASYVDAMYDAMFGKPRDMRDEKVVAEVLSAAGFAPAEILALAADPEAKQALIKNTEEAVARGVFGAPTFFVGEEMFWGQDRMDAVAEALA